MQLIVIRLVSHLLDLLGEGGVLGVAVEPDDAGVVLAQLHQGGAVRRTRGHLLTWRRTVWGAVRRKKRGSVDNKPLLAHSLSIFTDTFTDDDY